MSDNSFSKAAHEYRYLYRFNPIPFDTKENVPTGGYKWKEYQDGISEDKHKEWEVNNKFNKGIAIILGKAREREGFPDCFVFAIDLDGKSAIEQFCLRADGSKTTLEQLSKIFKVDQHSDDPDSVHIIGYSTKKLKTKYVVTKPHKEAKLKEKIEVKADKGFLINISPSFHKNGTQWARIGEEKVPDIDEKGQIENHLIEVFKRNGSDYLSTGSLNDAGGISREQQSGLDLDPELPVIEAASEAIMFRHAFLTIEETGEIWYYDNGVYIRGGEIVIAKEAELMYGYDMNKSKLSEITAHITRRTYHKHEELDADIHIINLKNGLYNIDLDCLLPHSPQYLSINQKPITYVKDAKPKRFWQYLREVLYPRDIRTATSAMAYTFHRDYIVEVIFILHGFGANGKGVYTSTLTALHGPRNVSNVPLSDMLKDTFALSDMESKDLNIDNELAGQTVKETAVLKRLTGGSRQPIRIQRKNQKAYDTILYAKLFFSANKIPESADTSNAYNRRMIIIPFPNTFEKTSEDKQLSAKLSTDGEISGIFNVLMAELRRIRRTKEVYVNEKTIEEKRQKYERAVNPIKAFMEEAVAEDSQADAQISKPEFYIAYVKYCKKYALPPEKYDYFYKILKNQFNARETRVEIRQTRKWERWWLGYTLTDEYATGTSQEKLRTPWAA